MRTMFRYLLVFNTKRRIISFIRSRVSEKLFRRYGRNLNGARKAGFEAKPAD
jgi:hypothetical protein